MNIDEFIEIVYPKLKHEVVMAEEFYTGEDMALTGYSKPLGGWDKNKMYPIPVPAVKKIDHRLHIRMAWLKKGKVGVEGYLKKYISESNLEKVMGVLDDPLKKQFIKEVNKKLIY